MNQVTFIIIAIVLVLLEEFVLANNRYFWLGGILPAVGTIGLIFIWLQTPQLRFYDYIMLPFCFLFMLYSWGYGHYRYKKRVSHKYQTINMSNMRTFH